MAKYGIVADVHGNLAALNAALGELDGKAIRDVLCLGDLIGFCAEPNECVAVAQARGFHAIAGNHELVALEAIGLDRCGSRAAWALTRTRKTLSPASRAYLEALPASIVHGGDVVCIHGSVDDVCEYMSNEERIVANANALAARYPAARVCLFGHTHVPRAYELRDGRIALHAPLGTLSLGNGSTWFVNPGSVDGSRAPVAEARFGVYDDAERTFTFLRATYDHAKVERRARRAGYRISRTMRVWRASSGVARSLLGKMARGAGFGPAKSG